MTENRDRRPKNLKKIKICYLVSNDITHDPRVAKQIDSASRAGFKVLALGYGYPDPFFQKNTHSKGKNLMIIRGEYPVGRGRAALFKPIFWFFRALASFILSPDKTLKRCRKFFRQDLLYYIRITLMTIFPRFYKILLKKLPENLLSKLRTSNKNDSRQIQPATMAPLPLNAVKTTIDGPKNNPYFKIKNYIHKHLAFMANLSFYWEMTRFFVRKGIEYRPEIIHANDLDTLLAGYLIKKKTGAKLIYDAHEIWTKQGLLLPPIILFIFSQIEKFVLSKIDAFISVNESIIKEISKMYRHKFKVVALPVYNCPSYQKIDYRVRRRVEIKVLYQGRYCFDRGLEELTESARYLPENIKIYFRAMGDPLTQQKLKEIVQKYGLNQKVKFLLPVAMAKMVESAQDFDIGVISYIPANINNTLCTPNKLFEYMHAGLALAVSDLPELKRIIRENRNGRVFNPRRPYSIAQALIYLAQDRARLNQMRKNSLLVAQKYNWQNEEQKLIHLYYALISSKK